MSWSALLNTITNTICIILCIHWLDELKGVSFLWLGNLWAPDRTFILPILSAATTYFIIFLNDKVYLSNKLGGAPGEMNMNTMNLVMAGMMGVMSITIPITAYYTG